ncbi:MAG: DEAD/DEAH box helicase family protein [Desulfuromonadales bacterium]|nr:DEAD/DEAH box helicase family protein [Desulfuromonadales bacterium]
MSFNELFEKYQGLVTENSKLKEENRALKSQLGIEDTRIPADEISSHESAPEVVAQRAAANLLPPVISKNTEEREKIRLFMSLFKGRHDVYAKRWENKKKGTSGYSPSCLNEWKPGVCPKPKVTCASCTHKAYAALDEKVTDDHLRGKIVAGIYPMLPDETCWFLAIDFDDGEWQKDISVLRDVCAEFTIPISVERSRSGNGSHAWLFFERPIPACLARKFGTSLLTYTMQNRHEITFKSYDRFFPNQDTMPKGGLGNLIALPLQKEARKAGNSEFIDMNFVPYPDQWAFFCTIQRLSEDDVISLALKLGQGNELGVLKIDEEEAQKPWEATKVRLLKTDFPREMEIVKANMLYVPKAGISQRALNQLKRLAAFKNPEFYKNQAMRMSTYGKSRIICCADDTAEYLCLPRGCEQDLRAVLATQGIDDIYLDKTNHGKMIDVEFSGNLRDEQPLAMDRLLEHDIGVLSGTTAFGKTVVAIKLISERKVNTLIIVDKASLITQWKNKLTEFLTINESLPVSDSEVKKRGRKKARSIIGQLGQGKNSLGGIIDIALMQSLNRKNEVKECVKDYGMIIIDECHHVAAVSFDEILKSAKAKYVYGLTATPTRKDGHHPIIFMQCGPVRYRDDAKKQAEKRPFDHFVIPRFTSLRVPLDKDEKDVSIQENYSLMVVNEMRNQLIVDDVVKSHESGRNCLVLSDRTAHVELIAGKLRERIPEVMTLRGGRGTKEIAEIFKRISDTPADKQLTLVATGRYIGEGFDEPRLDTLFLTMPISWKGTLQQYAGRLHRLFEVKKEVQIYDYVDTHVRMLEKMYHKRLNGYASIGYKAKGGGVEADSVDIIFDKSNFLPVYSNDILSAEREILIVSPFITKRRTVQMMQNLEIALRNKVRVIVVTRPVEDFGEKEPVALQGTLAILRDAGVSVAFRPNIHQKFALIDQRIVWYGSINLLSFGSAEESIMRLDSPNIAGELLKSVENAGSTGFV